MTAPVLYRLDRRPSSEFRYEAGKRKLANAYACTQNHSSLALITPGDRVVSEQAESITPPGHLGVLLKVCADIDLENNVSVGCAGALLTYLQRRKAMVSLPRNITDNSIFHVSTFEMFNLRNTM